MGETKSLTPAQRHEQILDGCTRLKVCVVALKRLGCSVSQATVGGKHPKIVIDPPTSPELAGETVTQWVGAGGRRMVTYVALFLHCRVEWTRAVEG